MLELIVEAFANSFARSRFGNYIGETGDSEEESQHGDVQAQNYAYDEESEEEQEVNDQQLMEIDG